MKLLRILLITMLVFLYTFNCAYCKTLSYIELRDKILSLASQPDMPDSIYKVLNEVDNLPQKDQNRLYSDLIDYYIGEHPGEVLTEKITNLQDKILPFLIEKKNSPLKCLEKYKNNCLDFEIRQLNIERMIDAIKNGIVLYGEYPDNLNAETEKTLKLIEIFISDYKNTQGALPSNLSVLRKYALEKYYYKLVILDPYGVDISYTVLEKDKYKIKLKEHSWQK